MTASIVDWPRPHFAPGGGDAFLFYVVFGPISADFEVSRNEYRCDGMPAGMEIQRYGPQTHPEVLDAFRDGYLWADLHQQNADLRTDISRQTEALVLRAAVPDPPTLNYLRNTIGLVTSLFDVGGVGVYDPQMFRWWSPRQWRAEVFEPNGPVPRHHVTILVSEDGEDEWVHTRGMRKFGRPDLSVHRVGREHKAAVVDLCNRFIEFQAFGGVIAEGQEIRVPSLPERMTCTHRGELDDPDFNNVHVEIRWPHEYLRHIGDTRNVET